MLRRVKMRAFTLIELLVVIAILAILATFLIPAVTGALLKGKVIGLVANGKSIHQALFAKSTEDVYVTTASSWPNKGSLNVQSNSYPDSTEFFRMVVTSGIMNVSFSYFAAPEIPSAQGKNVQTFKEENNAWDVTAGMNDGSDEEIPFLMTRNLQIDNMNKPIISGSTLLIGSEQGGDPRTLKPFGAKAFVFVTKGGSGFGLSGPQMQPNVVTNLFQQSTNDLKILRPWQ
jgi:prepilin-type N-terminal cleavage/methylation domain-containing protein